MAATAAKTPGKKEEIVLRRTQVMDYRLAGMSTRDIARQLDVCQATVVKDIKAVLNRHNKQQQVVADRLRNLEDMRLDQLLSICIRLALGGDLQAVEEARKLSKDRRELWGLDAPKGIDITSQGKAVKGYIGFSPEEWDSLNKPQGGTPDQQSDVEEPQPPDSASGSLSV